MVRIKRAWLNDYKMAIEIIIAARVDENRFQHPA